MVWDGMNGRKFPRVNYKCRIRVCRDAKERTIDTCTENIGQGGICVSLSREIKIFENVALEVFVEEGQESVKCRGKVVWVVKGGSEKDRSAVLYDTGVEFTDIQKRDRNKIGQLIGKIIRVET